MKSLIIPYGNEGWSGRFRIIEELVSSRPAPPFMYDDLLILVPSARMKRSYGRLFLELAGRKGAAIVPPAVRTLHEFMQNLSAQSQSPRLLDEISRMVLIEGLVKEHLSGASLFGQHPDLLAPSLSAALARMIDQLSAAGVTSADLAGRIRDADFADKPQVTMLVDVYTRYGETLARRDLTDPAGMLRDLIRQFTPEWVTSFREIIIDGIHDAGRLETALLRKVMEYGNCTWLVDAPSAETLHHAGESHPLTMTNNLLSALGLSPHRNDTGSTGDDLFLGEALFSDSSFSETAASAPVPASFQKEINLISAVNKREEVSRIASAAKQSIRRGVPPDSLLVAFPSLDEYGPLVEEIFTDYGIPYNRALGRQLSTSPVATSVVSLLRVCQEDFSGASLLRVFSSPFLKFSEDRSLAPALDRLLRDRRITGGRERLISLVPNGVKKDGKDILSGPLRDLFTALQPLAEKHPASLARWMERLGKLISWSGLGARVMMIKGPLNVNLQAYRKFIDTLAALGEAGTLFPEFTYTFNEWLFLLKKTFMHTRFQVPPEDEGGVQILGLEESAGHPWSEIYLGGLVDGAFPRRLPQNIFLPEATLETWGVKTLEKARLTAAYHFYRLLLSAKKVTLSWPEHEGDRPASPSPFLMELTPLRHAGLLKESAHVQFSLKPEESRSLPELAKAISIREDIKGIGAVLGANIDGISGIRSAVRSCPPAPGLVPAPAEKREFWVTELEAYLACPYDYYVTNILGLSPLEEATEDISPLERGNKVHAILRNFYLSWKEPVTRENRGKAKACLRSLAEAAFAGTTDTVRNRRERDFFVDVVADRFLDAEEAFWKQGMRPVYLEQKIESFKLLLADGTEATIKARIDRLDADEQGNFIVVDYKTGEYPKPKMGLEQDIFQLPVYAVMARQLPPSSGPVLRKPVGLAYYDLSGRTGAGARDVVLFNKDAFSDPPASKPKASPKSEEDFEEILNNSLEKARKAVEGILAGDFAPPETDPPRCRFCPNDLMCEKPEP